MFVATPPRTIVWIPRRRSCRSSSVPWKAPHWRLVTRMSSGFANPSINSLKFSGKPPGGAANAWSTGCRKASLKSLAKPTFSRTTGAPALRKVSASVLPAFAELGDAVSQLGIVTIAGNHQRHAARKAGLARPADLIKRDLRLGLERDLLGHPRLAATYIVLGPRLRQVQPVGHRQARVVIGKRQRYRRLAVRLLAKLSAVLVRYPDRMSSLLGKARVVDDPGLDRAVTLDPRQHHFAHLAQHLRVGPASLADKMQQRLMLRRRSPGRRDRRHRLYALALARHDQSRAIIAQWTRTIRVPDHTHKPIDIAAKPQFNVFRSVETHPKPPLCSSGIRLHK